MAIDKQLLLDKIKQLEVYLREIERMEFSDQELLENRDIQDLISFRIQQAVEISIDIATHIVSAMALPQQDTAVGAMQLLAKEKIISKKLSPEIANAVRFRNLIVHHYGNVDFEKVYKSYKEDIQDLRQFAEEIYDFVQKQES